MVLLSAIAFCSVLKPAIDIDADSPEKAAPVLRRLIKDANPEELKSLERSPDSSVALEAAWARSIKPADVGEWIKPGTKVSAEFLRVFKARTEIVPPPWWPNNDASRGDSYYFSNGQGFLPLNHGKADRGKSRRYVWRARGPMVTLSRLANGQYKIRDDLRRQFRAAAIRHRGRYLLASSSSLLDGSFYLFGFKPNGMLAWKRMVWTTGVSDMGGFAAQSVTMKVHQGNITIFGRLSWDSFAEEFRISDGKPIFRFSTNFWGVPTGEESLIDFASRLT